MLDVLFIQKPLAWLSQISLGTCWPNIIGFCDVAYRAGYKGTGPSLKHCVAVGVRRIHNDHSAGAEGVDNGRIRL